MWRRLWRRRAVRITGELLLIVIVFVAVRAYTQRDMVTGVVPELSGQLLDGRHYALLQSTKRPVLVHFWATWCPICKFEQDNIQSLSEHYAVISVAMQSGSEAEVSGFMHKENLSFAVLNDPDGILAQRFGVKAVPSSFIVDADNQIAFHESGYSSEWGLRLRLWLAE